VKFFGPFLIDSGEVDASHVREALHFMDAENPELGQVAIAQGFMQTHDVTRVHAEQRNRDLSFGDLAVEMLPRFMLRVARIHAKVGEIHPVGQIPDYAEVSVSVPMRGALGLDVALVSDIEFAEALATVSSGLEPRDLDPEMVADGVGEFLNVLCGNAGSALAKDGDCVELGPPDYEAEIGDGWIVDVAVGVGQACVVLSTP
jgi:CheY-specific phosphatase CheX